MHGGTSKTDTNQDVGIVIILCEPIPLDDCVADPLLYSTELSESGLLGDSSRPSFNCVG